MIFAQTAEAVPAATTEPGATETGAAPGNPLMNMLPMFIAFIAIMYFLMIRPQQKREKERREMLNSIDKGDSVVTTGGICGTVVALTDANVVLRVDDNVTMQFIRSAVSQVAERAGEPKGKKK